MTASATSTDVSCNAGNDGTATATPSGGTAPFTFAWSNGANTATINTLIAGTYTVTITDNAGCTATASTTVTEPTAVVVTTTVNNNVSCNAGNDGAISASTSGGFAPTTLLWSTRATTVTINNLIAGTYSVTATDNNGCSASTSATITEPTAVVATTTNTATTCAANDGTATAVASGGTSAYTFAWSNGGNSATITGLIVGTYTVTVTDENGCTTSATTSISNGCVCSASISSIGTDPSCNGGCDGSINTTTTNMLAPISFVWSNGATTQNPTSLCQGTYSVTATDANGCTASTSTTLSNPAAMTVNTTVSNETCAGNNGAATASPSGSTSPYSYQWSNGGNTVSISGLAQGTYTVTATSANGCTATATAVVGFNNSLSTQAIVSQQVSCAGGADGEAQAVGLGAATITYQWSNGAAGQIASGLTAGVHSVTITGGICSAVRSVTVTEPAAMNLNVVNSHSPCVQGTGQIVSTVSGGGGSPYNFIWSNGASAQNLSNLAAGTYTLTVTDGSGCTTITSTTINITQGPSVSSVFTAPSCNSSGDGSIDVTVSPSGNYSFLWNNGATTEDLSGINSGIFTVQVTDTASGCVINHSDTVSGPAPLTAVFSTTQPSTPSHSNGAVSVAANGGTSPFSFVWNTGSTADQLLGIGTGTYIVTITDANGCSLVDSITVTAFTAIDDIDVPITSFVVMPNPSNGYFTVKIELATYQEVDLRMTDVLGRTIYEQHLEGQTWALPMDWDRLAAGTYLITIKTGTAYQTQKVIIVK